MTSAKIPVEKLLPVLASPARWHMLRALAKASPISVVDLSSHAGVSGNAASKHVKVLLDAGIIELCHTRLYRLSASFPILPGGDGIDFGHCLLRFDVPVQ